MLKNHTATSVHITVALRLTKPPSLPPTGGTGRNQYKLALTEESKSY